MTIRAARRIPDLQPGSAEWLQIMTASKVGAVLGLSTFESRFSLWYRMAGQVPATAENTRTRRGHYLEPAVADWFADQYPHLRIGRTGSWQNKARPWQSATPDRIAREGRRAVAVVECKTDAGADHDLWGREGSDEIPPRYRAQVVWQMDTLGVPLAYVAVLLGRLTFRSYVIRYDQAEAEFIRAEARAFLDSLPGGPAECPPDVDDHDQTWQVIRELHPEIADRDHLVDPQDAREFIAAHRQWKAGEAAWAGARNRLAAAMGDAQYAVAATGPDETERIARREAKRTSATPYLVAAATFPHIPEETR